MNIKNQDLYNLLLNILELKNYICISSESDLVNYSRKQVVFKAMITDNFNQDMISNKFKQYIIINHIGAKILNINSKNVYQIFFPNKDFINNILQKLTLTTS